MEPEPNPSPQPPLHEDSTATTGYDLAPPLTRIGPYQIVRNIGEGGMGIVYYARQLEPIRRDVALKLIKPGMDTRQVIARFDGERKALALMDHPNIARVLDAGTTSNGLPYFVMELVFGTPITKYCDAKRLTLNERIALFIPVCRAIQHAHQKGMIHRDIKPSNVLVSEHEGKAVPKVIDFGLAKALSADLSDATMMTNPGVVVGTLPYMSPEQAEPGKQDIDTRSDVYSLGALLYELVTGSTPLGRENPDRSGYMEMLHRIRAEEPAPPSQKAKRADNSAEIAARRKSDPAQYPTLLRGEFDWVVMKALEKDRSRRYETANGLARDLERFLAGEPLEAAPAQASYRLRKLLRKHRAWLATAAAFMLLLMAGVVVSSWMAIRARRAEREALEQRNAANSVNDFLTRDVLAQAAASNQAGPAIRPDPDLKVRTALDRAAARIGGNFAAQPLVEASIRYTIATSYQELGLYPAAEPHALRSLEIRRRELGEGHVDTAKSYQLVGRIKWMQGKYAESENFFAKALATQRRKLGEEHPDTLTGIDDLASAVAYQGKWSEAEKLFSNALDIQRRVLGPDNTRTLGTMNNLAATCFREGEFSRALALHTQALEIRRRVLGPEHPATLLTLNNIGQVYSATGDYARAEGLFMEVLALRERVLGAQHPNTLTTVRDLGTLRLATHRYAEADPLLTRALEARTRVLGERHPDTLASVRDLAKLRDAQGRSPEAETLLTKALEGFPPSEGEKPEVAALEVSLGEVRLHALKYAQAEEPLRYALAAYQNTAPDTWPRYKSEYLLGASLAGQNNFSAAEPLLLSGYQGVMRLNPTVPVSDRLSPEQAAQPIVQLYQNAGRLAEAAKWRNPGRPAQ